MTKTQRLLGALVLLSMLLAFAAPAHAFDGRSGDKVVVAASETVNDTLYVAASEFVLDGTIKGGVIAGAQIITVNGTIDGNLIAVASSVVINGTVTGDVLAGGSELFFGENARIGGDIVAGGVSLQLRKGGTVGRDAVVGAGQILLGGTIGRNVMVGTGALEIDGTVGGNVSAAVGEAGQAPSGPPPSMFMPQSTVPIPAVKQGLTIDPAARINGNLEYTQNSDLVFPAGVVAGTITRHAPPADSQPPVVRETPGLKVAVWGLDHLRSLVTLILVGLFLLWLLPGFVRALTDSLQAKPWPSVAWGVVTYAAFFFLILLILFVAIVGGIVFGLLTLGGLSGAIIWLGILALLALIVGFVLAASFLTKIVFGAALGKWILLRVNSPLATHRYWPMVIGVAITVAVIALLSFPLIPGFLGALLNFIVVLFGLGALWLWASELVRRKPAATA